VPHVHAIYGEFNAVFAIETLEMLEGDLPARAHRLVNEWAEQYKRESLEMWNHEEFRQRPGEERTYDCEALLSRPQFRLLTDPAFFRRNHASDR
jgi:hypothetical protein